MSLVGAGMKSHPASRPRPSRRSRRAGIEPPIVTTSPIKIACHVAAADVDRAVQALTRRSTLAEPPDRRRRRDRRRRHGHARAAARARLRRRARVRLGAVGRARELGGLDVEEATPEALAAGDLDLCLFSVGTSASRELVPHAVRGGAVCVDKSAAYRLDDGVPLVVPEVNGAARARARTASSPTRTAARSRSPARSSRCTTRPGLARVRVATYQSVSGRRRAGDGAAARRAAGRARPAHGLGLRRRRVRRGGEAARGDAQDPRAARAAVSATCVRVPVLVGHAEAVWIETRGAARRPSRRPQLLARRARASRLEQFPTPGARRGSDDVLVGRIRRDPTVENGLALFLVGDNLRKGAALNAIQIAELLLAQRARRCLIAAALATALSLLGCPDARPRRLVAAGDVASCG